MIAVFAHACPAGEQRPDAAVVVTAGIVAGIVVRDDAGAPVSFEIRSSEAVNHQFRFSRVQQMEPHRNSSQNACNVNLAVVWIKTEDVDSSCRVPEELIEQGLLALGGLLQFADNVGVPRK